MTYIRQKQVDDKEYTLRDRGIFPHDNFGYNQYDGRDVFRIEKYTDKEIIKYGLWNFITHQVVLEPIFSGLTPTCYAESWFAKLDNRYYVLSNEGNIILQSVYPIACSFPLCGGVYEILTDKDYEVYHRNGELLGKCPKSEESVLREHLAQSYENKERQFKSTQNKIINAIPNIQEYAVAVTDEKLAFHYVQLLKTQEEYETYLDDLMTLEQPKQRILKK